MIHALAGSAAIAALAVGPAVRAADPPDAQTQSVRGVGKFEADPIGIELDRLIELPFDLVEDRGYDPDEPRGFLSNFTVFPQFEVDNIYTDNIFRVSTAAKSDWITIYRPILDISGDIGNHTLFLQARADVGRHRSNPIENFEDYTLLASFTLDVDDFTDITTDVTHSRSHGQRGDIDDPGQELKPDIQFQTVYGVSFVRNIPDALQLDGSFRVSKISFENNGPIDNSDRWRTDYDSTVRVGWEIEQGTVVFVQPRAVFTRFRRQFDDFGVQRDFDDYELTAGIRLDPSPITFLEFLAGLTNRRFVDESFQDGTDYLVRGAFIWNPNSVMTLNGSIDQSFAAAASEGISGTLSRTFTTSFDWTPVDSVILTARAVFRTEEFESSISDRGRDTTIFGLSAEWAINRNWFTELGISTENQSGDLPSDSMTENRIQLRVGVQL